MNELIPLAERVAALLIENRQTVAVSESSTGGLIMASLLAVPGASAYCFGGVVLYTTQSWWALRGFSEDVLQGCRSATKENALIRASFIRDRFNATWGIGETGAAGPAGNRYGDPAGHTCIAVSGPVESAIMLRTGRNERVENMLAFSRAALTHFHNAMAPGQR
jgi:PncC family amidohydrolase